MANTPKVYVICDANCKWEGMTKEQILTAITQAVSTGEIGDINTGFVQTINTINGIGLKFFVGEQAEYDALSAEDKENLFAIITNDIAKDEVLNIINELAEKVQGMESGEITVGNANTAQTANRVNASGTTGKPYNSSDLPIVFVEGYGQDKKTHSSLYLTYNPQTRTLKADNIDGKASEAAKADEAEMAAFASAMQFNKIYETNMTDGQSDPIPKEILGIADNGNIIIRQKRNILLVRLDLETEDEVRLNYKTIFGWHFYGYTSIEISFGQYIAFAKYNPPYDTDYCHFYIQDVLSEKQTERLTGKLTFYNLGIIEE